MEFEVSVGSIVRYNKSYIYLFPQHLFLPSGPFQVNYNEIRFTCLPGHVVNKVLDCLDITCLFKLGSVASSLSSTIKAVISTRLDKRLGDIVDTRSNGLFDSLKQIPSHIAENRAIAISGSTMVQTILDKLWGNSDIDIYCSKRAVNNVRRVLVEHNFILVRSGIEREL